jgi:hypothetical protein
MLQNILAALSKSATLKTSSIPKGLEKTAKEEEKVHTSSISPGLEAPPHHSSGARLDACTKQLFGNYIKSAAKRRQASL